MTALGIEHGFHRPSLGGTLGIGKRFEKLRAGEPRVGRGNRVATHPTLASKLAKYG
jgi:hypothetical protein